MNYLSFFNGANGGNTVVAQSTQNPKFMGSIPTIAGTGREKKTPGTCSGNVPTPWYTTNSPQILGRLMNF
jgi:hypothetical protein